MSTPTRANLRHAAEVMHDLRMAYDEEIMRRVSEALDQAEHRAEARIVAWLRTVARSDVALCGDMTAGSGAMLHAAGLIERGDHRKETPDV